MGAITFGVLDIASAVVGGIVISNIGKIFGGNKTSCPETGVTKEQALAKLEALKTACDKCIAAVNAT
jgi:hypothetical protein